MRGIFRNALDSIFTKNNAAVLVLGVVGGLIIYQMGKRTGNYIYEEHIEPRRKYW